MKYIIFVLTLIFFGCNNNKNKQLEKLPKLDDNFSQSDLQKRVDLSNTNFGKELITRGNKKINGIARFNISEMDTTKIRPFELILLEVQSDTDKKQMFVSIDKKDNSIIDLFQFSSDSLLLDAVYSHSSELDHDAIAIEFIDKFKAIDQIYIYGHSIEVLETGKIKYLSKYEDFSETFYRLPRTKKDAGFYQYSNDNGLKIDFELKNGVKEGYYAFQYEITTPKGCSNNFINLEYNFKDNIIKIDSIGSTKVIFENNKVKVINPRFQSECDEIIKLNFELNKTQ